jgi:GST-like protein
MAIWPWAILWEGQQQTLEDKPNFARWLDHVGSRPAVIKGKDLGAEKRARTPDQDKEAQKVLFGQKG